MNNEVSNFIFHKDVHGIWNAVKRENYFDLFNDRSKVLYRSRDIKTLEDLIEKTNGDPANIDLVLEKERLEYTDRDKVGCVVRKSFREKEKEEEKIRVYY